MILALRLLLVLSAMLPVGCKVVASAWIRLLAST